MLFLKENAKIIGQGITGSEGMRALQWAKDFGTNFVAGVTPGKGGTQVLDIPIFNSVAEAINETGDIDGSVIFVPPKFAKDAAFEALDAGINFILIIAEKVPTQDAALIYAKAKELNATVIGPNSVGLINPAKKLKLGLIFGENPSKICIPGDIAVISKSGSMTAEISLGLKKSGLGISWACGIGGDRIIGTDFADFIIELEKDDSTKASVVFGELGGTYEEELADAVKKGKIKKPVVAFIGGDFTLSLPTEVQFGHAGAIIEGERGKPDHKRRVLEESGVKVAKNLDEIPDLIKNG